MIKIGSVELTEAEAMELYQNEQYIVAYKKVYQLHYSEAQGMVYGHMIYQKDANRGGMGYTKRGRFVTLNARQVNDLIGFELLNA